MGFDPMTHCVLVDALPTELYIHTYTRAAELAGMNRIKAECLNLINSKG